MVDILLEYGYYIVGIGVAVVAGLVSYFSARKSIREYREEQRNTLKSIVTDQVDRLITKIDNGTQVMNEKFTRTDHELATNKTATNDIKNDVEILEADFKNICYKIGKHDYAIDKILPEYMDLKDSINNFKNKIDQNLLTNNEEITRNIEHDKGSEGSK